MCLAGSCGQESPPGEVSSAKHGFVQLCLGCRSSVASCSCVAVSGELDEADQTLSARCS